MKQFVKKLLVPKGRKLRRLRGGIAKDMLMNIDLATQSQRYWGFEEKELLPSLRRLIPPCKSLVDVGANDGYYTIAFLGSPAERIVACEPGPALDRLLINAKANGYQLDNRFAVETNLVGSGEGSVRLSEIVRNLPRPILIKMDIDGGEFDVLESVEGCTFLPELKWIIETHSRELEHLCIDWLERNGYQTRVVYNARWRLLLPEQRPIPHNRWLVAEVE